MSSASSLRTFVDPSRGASPGTVYPQAGLFGNIAEAYNNFYSSTDEGEIEAALLTARQMSHIDNDEQMIISSPNVAVA